MIQSGGGFVGSMESLHWNDFPGFGNCTGMMVKETVTSCAAFHNNIEWDFSCNHLSVNTVNAVKWKASNVGTVYSTFGWLADGVCVCGPPSRYLRVDGQCGLSWGCLISPSDPMLSHSSGWHQLADNRSTDNSLQEHRPKTMPVEYPNSRFAQPYGGTVEPHSWTSQSNLTVEPQKVEPQKVEANSRMADSCSRNRR